MSKTIKKNKINKLNSTISKTSEIKKNNNNIYKNYPHLKETFNEFIKVNSQKNHPFGSNEKRCFFSNSSMNLNDLEKRLRIMGFKFNDNLEGGIGKFIYVKNKNKNFKNKPRLCNSVEKYKNYCNPLLFNINNKKNNNTRNKYNFINNYNCNECKCNKNPKKLIKSNSYNELENYNCKLNPFNHYFIKQYTHHLLY
jgi:hypothetical protein